MEKKTIGEISKTLKYGQMKEKDKKIINDSQYITNGESLLIIKDNEHCQIFLNHLTTTNIKIKALTKVKISGDYFIDSEYEEIEIDNGACVELQFFEEGWYILSSDGIKM